MKEDSKRYRFTCSGGKETGIWNIGGIPYQAYGNPRSIITFALREGCHTHHAQVVKGNKERSQCEHHVKLWLPIIPRMGLAVMPQDRLNPLPTVISASGAPVGEINLPGRLVCTGRKSRLVLHHQQQLTTCSLQTVRTCSAPVLTIPAI